MKTNTLIKSLVLPSLLMLTSISYSKSVAETKEELEIPTLTDLYNQTPSLSSIPSAYQLEEVTDDNPAGTFTIIKYLEDPITKELTSIKYNVVFNETLGDTTSDTQKYFKWTKAYDYDSKIYLVETDSNDSDIDITTGLTLNYNTYKVLNGNINGDFVGSFKNEYYSKEGGAIYNKSDIFDITGNFVGNYIRGNNGNFSGSYFASGGAIYNIASIENIIGDFIGNTVRMRVPNSAGIASGGAIYNSGVIGDITGDFIYNISSIDHTESGDAYGGAIYNTGSIKNITGDFYNNKSCTDRSTESGDVCGGAIYNKGLIENITGGFYNNNAYDLRAKGGAICNDRTINNIIGDFIGNYVKCSLGSAAASSFVYPASGGAIYNSTYSSIGQITGDFIGNYASAGYCTSGGGIYNGGTIYEINGDFIDNYSFSSTSTSSSASYSYGGAVYNAKTIEKITGDFIGNYAASSYNSTYTYYYILGGAIYNSATIANISGDFIGNYVDSFTASLYSGAYASGGAIYNLATIADISGDFIGNYADSYYYALGGAIYNSTSSSIGQITGDFIGNYTYSSYSKTSFDKVKGGAIYNEGEISLLSIDSNMEFVGNYIEYYNSNNSTKDGTKTFNAIYNISNDNDSNAILNFNAYNGNKIVVNDGIDGGSNYIENQLLEINVRTVLEQEGAISYGTVEFNNIVANQTINVYNGDLSLGSYTGGLVVVADYSYTTSASIASLSNVFLNIEEYATLNISTNSDFDSIEVSSTSITLDSGSTLLFDAFASLTIDSSSTITLSDDVEILIDFTNTTLFGDYEYMLISVADSEDYTIVYSYLEDNLQIDSSYSEVDWSISENGSEIWINVSISGTAVPEPSTYAMIFGALALGLAMYRRRK